MYMPTARTLSLSLVVTLCASGACSKEEAKKADELLIAPQAAARGQTEAELNAVLASIDGTEITVREFQDRINKQSPYIRARYTSTEQKREFLDNLIRFEVLAMAAKDKGFDKDPDVVRSMKQVMIQKLMKDRFDSGLSPEDITEEEMRAYYQEAEAEYHKPEEVRVSAIIVSNKAQAESAAKSALSEKGASNKGFRELVAAHSTDDVTKARGGDLRYFTNTNTELPKAVVDAAFQLKKTGDVAGPIDDGKGSFYIIKQTGHRKAIDKSFEEVKRQVQNRLYRDKRTQAQKDFVANLRKEAKIETFDDALEKVQIDASGASQDHGHSHEGMPTLPGTDNHGAPGHSHGAGGTHSHKATH